MTLRDGTVRRLLPAIAGLGMVTWGYAAFAEGATPVPAHLSLSAGMINYEGDEATERGGFGSLRLGYDVSPMVTIEGGLDVMPYLKRNDVYDNHTGQPVFRAGLDGNSCWAAGLSADALFHLNRAENRDWDPYLLAGLGSLYYSKERQFRDRVDVTLRYGAGLAYHFNPEWAALINVVGVYTLDKEEFNVMPAAGVKWRWGSRRSIPYREPAGLPPQAPPPPAAPGAAASKAPAVVKPSTPRPEDLMMFELVLNSADGQWYEYFSELDAIAKIIQSHPDSRVRIEGHTDQKPAVSERAARAMTESRAMAVRDYFIKTHAIARKRLEAVGLGFSRPKAPNDPVNGNPVNQRIEVHLQAPPSAP